MIRPTRKSRHDWTRRFLLTLIVLFGGSYEVLAKPVSVPVQYEIEGKLHPGLATFQPERPNELKIEMSHGGIIISKWFPCDSAQILQDIYKVPYGKWHLLGEFRNTPVQYPFYFQFPKTTVRLDAKREIEKIAIEGGQIRQPGGTAEKIVVLGKDRLVPAEAGRADRRIVAFDAAGTRQALLYVGTDPFGRRLAVYPTDIEAIRSGELSSLPLYSLDGKDWRFAQTHGFIGALSPGWPPEAFESMRAGAIPKKDLPNASLQTFMDGVEGWLRKPSSWIARSRACADVTGVIPPETFDPNHN